MIQPRPPVNVLVVSAVSIAVAATSPDWLEPLKTATQAALALSCARIVEGKEKQEKVTEIRGYKLMQACYAHLVFLTFLSLAQKIPHSV